MENTIRNIITGAAVAGTLAGCLLFGRGISDAQKNLENNHYYQVEQTYREADSNLSSASSHLDYTPAFTTFIPISTGKSTMILPVYHPAVYPSPESAKGDIETAMQMYHLTPEGKTDNLNLDEMLGEVASELPDSDYLTKYNGKSVDNNTFKVEREEIKSARQSIQQEIKVYDSKIPDELKDEKMEKIIELGLTVVCGGLIAIIPQVTKEESYY